jgi:hypothetical protein
MTRIRSKSFTAPGFAACVVVGYPLLARRWCLTWGAVGEEVRATMPGDALSPGADVVTTRAIAIAAPASAIWPWLVQMGPGRGGANTYDWIENLLGLDVHSADRILPEFQDVEIGDTVALGRGPALRFFRAKDGGTPSLASRVFTRYVMEPGSLVMERKMLLGIKKLAEAGAGAGADHTQGSR